MKGFTLLEVLIATAIASAISVGLFIALRQTMAFQNRVDTYADTYSRVTILQNQFERDFMGFFVPSEAYELVSTKTVAAGKAKVEQIDKIFFAARSKEQFGVLSFITTNAMQVYWGKTIGAPKPLIARVVYRLIKSKDQPDTFTLQRQENAELDFTQYESSGEKQKIRAYDIVGDIKEMKVTYIARVYTPSDKPSPAKDSKNSSVRPEELRDKKSSWTYKEFTEWDWSPKKIKPKSGKPDEKKNESTDAKKEQVSRVPFYVKITMELWDAEHTRTTPFEFEFVRKPFEVAELEKDTQPESKKKSAPQVPGAPGAPNLPPGMPDLSKVLGMFKAPIAGLTTPRPASIAQNNMMRKP